jgi:hypothetical protein
MQDWRENSGRWYANPQRTTTMPDWRLSAIALALAAP